jgi:hypothetical protein
MMWKPSCYPWALRVLSSRRLVGFGQRSCCSQFKYSLDWCSCWWGETVSEMRRDCLRNTARLSPKCGRRRAYYLSPDNVWVWRATVKWYWQGKIEEFGEKPVPVLLCPPQIPHVLTRGRTWDFAVRGRRLTAWAMALPDLVAEDCLETQS